MPPWVDESASTEPPLESELRLVLEPGRAFGTGLHATTALVAEMLDDRSSDFAGRELLDVGTGSGILALSALLLGASAATAIDNDGDVIEVVLENAERNGLTSRLSAWAGTTETVTRTFPWVLANIEARTLRPLAPELVRLLAQGSSCVLILSGLLEAEHDEMVLLYTSQSRPLRHLETRRRAGAGGDAWVAIAFAAVG